ncbi:MMPL family transporter [Streptomyces albipurpureus]|uniref:MMPL family transporter n=1 Tax=Streptomyces albipurpureus TaxID=2897419 RepID=A0ABT0UT75_9ACTN|nr:MMPL family transporter [Streptomyces sp. CWNU-1]MCM2391797.1 MMPL family transporter [Streptomyces sp. CWNU-1]
MPHPTRTGAPPRTEPTPNGLFTALAKLSCRRPRLLLLVTLVLLAGAVVLGSGVADRLRSGGSGGVVDPASESSYAAGVLEREFPGARPNLVLLAKADGGSGPSGVDAPVIARQGKDLAARLAKVPGVTGVSSYWSTKSAALRSQDGREALVVARIDGDELAAERTLKERVVSRLDGRQGDLTVRIGGSVAVQHEQQKLISEDLIRAELIALPITLLILMVVFGSAVAALLPLGIGVIAILGTNAVLRVITSFTDVSVFATNLTTALGLGLAIDYALLIVRRYREELDAGKNLPDALTTTLNTAGRTVLFSAATVAVSLAAMMVFPLYFLRSLAYAGISVVVLAAVAALVVLPALLVVLGPRIDAWDVRKLVRRRSRAAHQPRTTTAEPGAGWARLARWVMRRAPLVATGTLAALLLLGAPFLNVDFGTADYRQLPTSAESRVVQEHIKDGFRGSPTGAIEVVTERAGAAELGAYAKALSALPAVVRVDGPAGRYAEGELSGPAQLSRTSGQTSYLTVVPAVEAVSEEGKELVREVREVGTPFPAHVSGTTAALIDSQSAIGRGLPWAIGIIVLATLVLVFLLTGSVLVPVQAVLLNALSLTAMLGAVVWVFQDGNLSGLLGFTPTGSIETALPVLMFCLAFGLSMDYGVFLLSRINEERLRTPDHKAAVVAGIRGTGGVITAAAVVLAVVMVAIGTSRITNTKMLGLGVALAILMDAMVIRTLLVPAVLSLTGRATWWAPGPLRRLHARFGISEGGSGQPVLDQRPPSGTLRAVPDRAAVPTPPHSPSADPATALPPAPVEHQHAEAANTTR